MRANLGFAVRAAQEFGLVDLLDAERFRPVELRSWVRADDQRGRFLRETVGDMPPGGLDQVAGLLPGERRQRPGDDVRLVGQRAWPGGRRRLLERQAESFQTFDELAVARLGEESRDGVRDRRPDPADLADFLGTRPGDRS